MEAFEAGLKSALRALGRRDFSERAMRELLEKKGLEKDILARVMEELLVRGLIGDEETIGEMVGRASRRGYSRRRTTSFLREKGYDGELTTTALVVWGDERELENALAVLRKSYPNRDLDPDKRRKAFGLLARRGFDFELIRRAMNRHFGQSDEFSD